MSGLMTTEVVFGGTFDPFHVGHEAVIDALLAALRPDAVRVIPSASPPHRPPPQSTAGQRLQMVRLALQGRSGVLIDDRELKRNGPSYSADTLAELASLAPQTRYALALGADALASLARWERVDELLDRVRVAVVDRYGRLAVPPAELGIAFVDDASPALFAAPARTLCRVPMTPLHLSATEIRHALARGEQLRSGWLRPAVADYIEQHRLYRR